MRCATLVIAVFLIVVPFYSPTASAQSPVVRATLSPASGVLVGQPVRLTLTVLVPNYFTGSPDFPEFEIDNAIVVLPQDRPENSNAQIGGITYAGITEIYTIYPQQPGDFHLPPAIISFPYAIAPPKSATATLSMPPLTFHADVPAAARDLDYFLPTTQLTMQEKWSPRLKNLKAGDYITRTITVTASKTQAMLIPPLPMEAPQGIRVYQDQPIVQDQETPRGDFVLGRRTQSAKYFIQRKGDYTLPPIDLKWWNLATNRVATATLPAAHLAAAANLNYIAELPPEPEPTPVAPLRHISSWIRYKFWIRIVAPLSLTFLLFVWIGWHYLPNLARIIRERRRQRAPSEPAYFNAFQRACRRNDPVHSYEAFLKWLAIAHPGQRLDEILIEASSAEFTSEVDNLGASLFAGNDTRPQWNGTKLARLVSKFRSSKHAQMKQKHVLLPLNP